ncbi:MAG: heat-inducible transcription repressor HrcA [Proteobacteria bacterium]|nr:heat-inducible transcription repressor HrcA [Pseudomonadota bacterium]NIS70037.1 heat-inducible transcription repressor HrcA [Pseudomonadota bacterium]
MGSRKRIRRDFLESDRTRKILKAIIRDYIALAEPVSSRRLARRYGFDLSPATIRNVMADLEEMGYLSQPHTSAGRIPTEKAFRYYVDSIVDVKDLTVMEREQIKRSYHPSNVNVSETLQETCRLLSVSSNYLGLVITPRVSNMKFKHIQFVRLAPFKVLAVFVTASGIIQNKRLDTDEDFTQDYLDKITRYLSKILSGFTLAELRDRIVQEMKREKMAYDRLMERALKLGEMALSGTDERELFMEGRDRMFETPEFCNIEKMRGLLKTFEEKGFLLKLLDQCMKTPGVQIIIGSEFDYREMEDCSLITTTYGMPDSPRGTLGVIGPMRMNYSRVIPLVNYAAQLLTENFAESSS